MNPSRQFYVEALTHNSCLNKKISIDKEGNTRNCLSMPESFGNINSTSLRKALENKNFKKYWDVNKDKIAGSRDCEFQYIYTERKKLY